jgi:SAM-dependent methyltransferase
MPESLTDWGVWMSAGGCYTPPLVDATCPCCGAQLDRTPVLSGPDRLHRTPGDFEVAVCSSCGAGVTLPALSPAELAAFYPDTYGPYGDAQGGLVSRISRRIRRWQGSRALRTKPLEAIADREPGRLVDVGCGRGDLGAYLVGRGWAVTGIEPSANACEQARARGVDARQGTVETVELEDGAYDAAVFRHSLEHVTDPVAALERSGAALRPGGLVLISVPNFGGWQSRRFGSRWYHLDLPRHRIHFTPDAMERALERAGLEDVSVTSSTSAVGLPASIQYAMFGRCLFPRGLPLRVAVGLCALAWPAARVANGLGGGGDVLDVVGRRPL